MSNFIINGGRKLHGTIKTNSAKNSAVAILCALPMIKEKQFYHLCRGLKKSTESLKY